VKAKITDKELMMASCETLGALYNAMLALNPKAADVVKSIMLKKGCPIGGAPVATAGALWL
jgi:hypothetical protein